MDHLSLKEDQFGPLVHLQGPKRSFCPKLTENSNNNNQQESLAQWLGQLQTCENISIRDPPSAFEDVFHSIAIIIVSAIVLVIFILSVGLYVFK